MGLLKVAFDFITKRDRPWTLINIFIGESDYSRSKLIRRNCVSGNWKAKMKEAIALYYSPSKLKKYYLRKRKGY